MSKVYTLMEIEVDDEDLENPEQLFQVIHDRTRHEPILVSRNFEWETVQTAEDELIRMVDVIQTEEDGLPSESEVDERLH